jgi:hypothetical protein
VVTPTIHQVYGPWDFRVRVGVSGFLAASDRNAVTDTFLALRGFLTLRELLTPHPHCCRCLATDPSPFFARLAPPSMWN